MPSAWFCMRAALATLLAGLLFVSSAAAGPRSSSVVAIAAGQLHTCALTQAGAVLCWGDNSAGQLGDGTYTYRLTPVPVQGLGSGVQAIAAGDDHTCALTRAGAVLCWGANNWGKLGDGTYTTRTSPVAVKGLGSGVQAIAAGGNHTCALTQAGAVECWGRNTYGQLGYGKGGVGTERLTPVAVQGLTKGVLAIAAGENHTCALRQTRPFVECWGYNFYGQIGDGTNGTARLVPTRVRGLSGGVRAIAAGGNHTCVITQAGAANCWGWNRYGQIGDGTTAMRRRPAAAQGLGSGVQAMSGGEADSCAATQAGAVECWGANESGEIGDGTRTGRLAPVAVHGLGSGVRSIAVGGAHTCALTQAGAVWCWGYNGFGELGDGTRTTRLTPVAVQGL